MTTTISALAGITNASLLGTEVAPVDQAGVTVKMTSLQMAFGLQIPGVFSQIAGIAGFPNNAFTKITFDTVVTDQGAAAGVAAPYHSGATFNGITIPITGFYLLNWSISFGGAIATSVCGAAIGAAAVSNIGGFSQVSNNAVSGVAVSGGGIVSLTAAQNLSLFGFQNSGGTMSGITANLSIMRV